VKGRTLLERYLELDRKLVAVDMGLIKSMLMAEWVLENCPDYSSRALGVWAERLDGSLGEGEAIRRLQNIINECIKQAEAKAED